MKPLLHANLFSAGLGLVLAFVVNMLGLDLSGNDTLSVLALSGLCVIVTTMFGFTGSLGFIFILIVSQIGIGSLQSVGRNHNYSAVTSVVLFSCLFVPVFVGVIADQRRFFSYRRGYLMRQSRNYIKSLETRLNELTTTQENVQNQMFSIYSTPAEITASFSQLIRSETLEEGLVAIAKTIANVIPDTTPMIYTLTDDFYQKVAGRVSVETEIPDFISKNTVGDYPTIGRAISQRKLIWNFIQTPQARREVEVAIPFINQQDEVWGFLYLPVVSFLNCNLVFFNFLQKTPLLADSLKSRLDRKENRSTTRQVMKYNDFRQRINEELARSRDSHLEFALLRLSLNDSADANMLFHWRILGFQLLQSLRGHDLVANGEDSFHLYICIFREPQIVAQEMIPRFEQIIERLSGQREIDLQSQILIEIGDFSEDAESIDDFFKTEGKLSA